MRNAGHRQQQSIIEAAVKRETWPCLLFYNPRTMAYTILPATPADLPDIVSVHDAAFADDPFIGQLMPNVSPEVKQSHDMYFFTRQFEMSRLNGQRLTKAVDGNGYGSTLPTSASLSFGA